MEGVKLEYIVTQYVLQLEPKIQLGLWLEYEIKELAALSFGPDFVLQSFCHTAAISKYQQYIELQLYTSKILDPVGKGLS